MRRVDKILETYDACNDAELDAGHLWYTRESRELVLAAKGHPAHIVLAMAAVASPMQDWDVVKEIVLDYLEHGKASALRPLLPSARAKVRGLNLDRNVSLHVRGPKVMSFYENLLHPDTSTRVTLDRWAYRVVFSSDRGMQRLSNLGFYERLSDNYREAAARLNLLPHQVQAACWVFARGRA